MPCQRRFKTDVGWPIDGARQTTSINGPPICIKTAAKLNQFTRFEHSCDFSPNVRNGAQQMTHPRRVQEQILATIVLLIGCPDCMHYFYKLVAFYTTFLHNQAVFTA